MRNGRLDRWKRNKGGLRGAEREREGERAGRREKREERCGDGASLGGGFTDTQWSEASRGSGRDTGLEAERNIRAAGRLELLLARTGTPCRIQEEGRQREQLRFFCDAAAVLAQQAALRSTRATQGAGIECRRECTSLFVDHPRAAPSANTE